MPPAKKGKGRAAKSKRSAAKAKTENKGKYFVIQMAPSAQVGSSVSLFAYAESLDQAKDRLRRAPAGRSWYVILERKEHPLEVQPEVKLSPVKDARFG